MEIASKIKGARKGGSVFQREQMRFKSHGLPREWWQRREDATTKT